MLINSIGSSSLTETLWNSGSKTRSHETLLEPLVGSFIIITLPVLAAKFVVSVVTAKLSWHSFHSHMKWHKNAFQKEMSVYQTAFTLSHLSTKLLFTYAYNVNTNICFAQVLIEKYP